jgi:hypothetical protein
MPAEYVCIAHKRVMDSMGNWTWFSPGDDYTGPDPEFWATVGDVNTGPTIRKKAPNSPALSGDSSTREK